MINLHYMTHLTNNPDTPLRAGEPLRKGDVCWINEDGTVWRINAQVARQPVDGLAADDTAIHDPVTLLASLTVGRK